jgi:hypothetical protein
MKKVCYIKTILTFALTAATCGFLTQAQTPMNPNPGVLATPVDANTAVRFFYPPPNGNRFVYPLVFRVADPDDERMKIAPVLADGRTVYISLSEMQGLIAGMTRSIRMGQRTRAVEVFEPWEITPICDAMDVVVAFSKGAARGAVFTKDICKTLASLDSVIKTPRAHWEFQRFRVYDGCRVPGFDDAKYTDGK